MNAQPLTAALRRLRSIHKDMTLSQAITFLSVAQSPDHVTQGALSEAIGLTDSAICRTISLLGRGSNKRSRGLNLIEIREADGDRRFKTYALTDKGRALYEAVTGEMRRYAGGGAQTIARP